MQLAAAPSPSIATLSSQLFKPFGGIIQIQMSYDSALQKHKGYCFIEYDCPEAAALALEQMRNTTLSGRILKINRPNNVGPSLTLLDDGAAEAAKVRH
jgi:poly(U)-binding-splicing factor PUF60